jgi:hypothetical protein
LDKRSKIQSRKLNKYITKTQSCIINERERERERERDSLYMEIFANLRIKKWKNDLV